jgi:hypothetical protein
MSCKLDYAYLTLVGVASFNEDEFESDITQEAFLIKEPIFFFF